MRRVLFIIATAVIVPTGLAIVAIERIANRLATLYFTWRTHHHATEDTPRLDPCLTANGCPSAEHCTPTCPFAPTPKPTARHRRG